MLGTRSGAESRSPALESSSRRLHAGFQEQDESEAALHGHMGPQNSVRGGGQADCSEGRPRPRRAD